MVICGIVATRAALFSCGQVTTVLTITSTGTTGTSDVLAYLSRSGVLWCVYARVCACVWCVRACGVVCVRA
jgi:hypothetical protein